jgi:tRNA threonylcarbamoyladenosine biosynthesis protein TsaB
MLILALDAALARCSVALMRDGVVLAERRQEAGRGHASLLPPMVESVLAEAGVAAAALTAVAAVVGPGGFTGIRTALALAEGLALGAGIPVVAVTTGEALAEAVPAEQREGREVWTAVDTKRGRVVLERFAAALPFAGLVALGEPEAMDEAALPRPPGPVAVAGDAALAVAARLASRGANTLLAGPRMPEAAAVARVAARRLAGEIPPLAAQPMYVEPPAVRQP